MTVNANGLAGTTRFVAEGFLSERGITVKIVKASDEQGVTVPSPFDRTIKILLAPDKAGVQELTLSHVLIPPGGHTDSHTHDRPELLYIISGQGVAKGDGEECQVGPDTAIWVETDEPHELINPGDEVLKLITVFVPAYQAADLYGQCLQRAEEKTQ